MVDRLLIIQKALRSLRIDHRLAIDLDVTVNQVDYPIVGNPGLGVRAGLDRPVEFKGRFRDLNDPRR